MKMRIIIFRYYAILAFVGCCAVCSVWGQPRATKEQIAKEAESAEPLWGSPGSNYTTLVGLFIKPGALAQSNLLARIALVRDKAITTLDKAALHYLVGETYYWTGMAEVRRVRNKSAMDGEQAVAAYLAAWNTVAQGEESADLLRLRKTVATRLDDALGTSLCGANLSVQLKQQVVSQYIDRREKDHVLPMNERLQQRAQIYRNLGIQERLAAIMPASMPTNFQGVLRAMDLALSVGATNEALRYVEQLEGHYQDVLVKDPGKRARLFAVYKACKDPRGIACLKTLALTDPKAWLALYDFSMQIDPKMDVVQRRVYVEECLKGLTNMTEREAGAAYAGAAGRLVASGDHDFALALADKGISNYYAVRPILLQHKANIYARRGDQAKAKEMLQQGLDAAKNLGDEVMQEFLRQRMDAFSGRVEEEGVQK